MRALTITMDQPDAWLFECARMVVGRVWREHSARGGVVDAALVAGRGFGRRKLRCDDGVRMAA